MEKQSSLPFSTPTLQRKIIFYLLITELCQLVQPFYCSTLDCFPYWFQSWRKFITEKKNMKKILFHLSSENIYAQANRKFRPIIIVKYNTFSDGKLRKEESMFHMVPSLVPLHNFHFVAIVSYGAIWYGACIHRHYSI